VTNRGAILVTLLLTAGLAAAIAAVWNQYRQTHRALEFWGAEIAQTIDNAPDVELIDLRPPRDNPETGAQGPTDRSRQADISRAPGLIHFRRSLLEDANFDWATEPALAPGDFWDFAVRFWSNDRTVTVLFDLDRHFVADESSKRQVAALTARSARGLEQFFHEQLQKER
jgi:hypothetical protein